MANVKTCDICGSKMHKQHCMTFKVIIKRTIYNFMGENISEKLDVCENCMDDIRSIIKERRKNGKQG